MIESLTLNPKLHDLDFWSSLFVRLRVLEVPLFLLFGRPFF